MTARVRMLVPSTIGSEWNEEMDHDAIEDTSVILKSIESSIDVERRRENS